MKLKSTQGGGTQPVVDCDVHIPNRQRGGGEGREGGREGEREGGKRGGRDR